MLPMTFVDAPRLTGSVLASVERRCLLWIAARLPRRLGSDHLTLLALAGMFMTGVSYWAARATPLALIAGIFWLGVNWFGDSLDGTVARVRRCERPRYGFYVDHVVDCFGALFLFGGLALSGYMNPFVALGVLIAYLLLSIDVYLATYCLSGFTLSFWGIGPTELRLLLAIGNIALLSDPRVDVFGGSYRLFDVGGVIAIATIGATALASVARHVRALHRAEPVSGR